jgi:L-serine dehydratase
VNTSLFELFKIGIGPSSSHTVGPMRAALRFARDLQSTGQLARTARITVDLYGSLALTGIGHGTDRAILLGLLGEAPDQVNPAEVEATLHRIAATGSLDLLGQHAVPFTREENLRFHRDQMYPTSGEASHPNGMRFTAFDANGTALTSEVFYSIGGGFIVSEAEHAAPAGTSPIGTLPRSVPYPFRSAADLLKLAAEHQLTIAELMLANEVALLNHPALAITRPTGTGSDAASTPEEKIKASILALWQAMQQSIERGIATEGILPGGLNVRRRAHRLAERLNNGGSKDPLAPIDWVTVYAMAVNEENAAGGRVVTAPTNGAAGVIPAIAQYYLRFIAGLPGSEFSRAETDAGLIRYFLTAAAIGILYKENASISGAEVGCQGEVGVACSMAAGGLVAALNGSNDEIEHAAEIAMEHNLGMTCDPIGGLVQIPCIERNGMGAVKAINASRLAMHETEGHKLSLDQIIATMYQTGLDMQSRYKETSLAGLALNIIEC